MNRIEIYGTPMEHVFHMYYDYISEACGDGAALIVCENYKEASDLFIEWWTKNHRDQFTWFTNDRIFIHPRDEYENIVNYHDWNENFMFSDTTHYMCEDPEFIIKKNSMSIYNKEIGLIAV